MIVLDRPNRGAGVSRNEGISLAKGVYIGFVDSDDWIDLKMFKILYKDAKKNNTDVTMCDMFYVDGKSYVIYDKTKSFSFIVNSSRRLINSSVLIEVGLNKYKSAQQGITDMGMGGFCMCFQL